MESELESSDAMVLVVSEKVRSSKWVHNEVNMAEELGIPVIPVLAQSILQPLWLRHLQLLDFCGKQQWEVLVSAIESHVPIAKTLEEELDWAIGILEADLIVPAWAANSGEDQYGQYADLEYKNVFQRFRLIKAGTFWMGTKDSEGRRKSMARWKSSSGHPEQSFLVS